MPKYLIRGNCMSEGIGGLKKVGGSSRRDHFQGKV